MGGFRSPPSVGGYYGWCTQTMQEDDDCCGLNREKDTSYWCSRLSAVYIRGEPGGGERKCVANFDNARRHRSNTTRIPPRRHLDRWWSIRTVVKIFDNSGDLRRNWTFRKRGANGCSVESQYSWMVTAYVLLFSPMHYSEVVAVRERERPIFTKKLRRIPTVSTMGFCMLLSIPFIPS